MPSLPAVLIRTPRVDAARRRPRLVDLILGAEEAGVLLLGPSGSGKTVAAAAAARASEHRIVWARLAPPFTSAADLATLAAASAGQEVPPEGATLIELAGILLQLLEDEPTTLVVDNYEQSVGEECDPLIGEVLAFLPAGSRLIVCSQVRPPGLVGRAAGGMLRIIGADELAFTVDEAEALFQAANRSAGDGKNAVARTGGWAIGIAAEAEDPKADGLSGPALVERLDPDQRRLIRAMAVLPYLTDALAAHLGLNPPAELASQTALIQEQGGAWYLQEPARATIAAQAEPADDLKARAAAFIRDIDGPTAIDLFISVGRFDDAADVLADHLSEIGVRRAVHWLYQLPAQLRHRFPPVLALGKASVNLLFAVEEASRRVETAPNEQVRREGLLALGSAQANAGKLAAAARSLEAAIAPGAPPTVAHRAMAWLGIVRWWAGDLTGAEAALTHVVADGFTAWALGEVALARQDHVEARRWAEQALAQPTGDVSPALGLSLLARCALAVGEHEQAVDLADRAYAAGVAAGGLDLAVGAPPHAWLLVEAGRTDEALAIAETLRRQVARYDAFAQVHVALIEVAASRPGTTERRSADGRLTDLRNAGFAPVEAQARWLTRALRESVAGAARVWMLGPSVIEAGDLVLRRSDWKSQKALEVLRYLALAGDRGAGREEVIEAVWPDRDPEKGRTLLRTALAEIRRTLEPDRPRGESSRFLSARADRVELHAWTDVAEVQRLAHDRPAEALGLFRGAFLEDDPYVEWAEEQRWANDALRVEIAKAVAGSETAPAAQRRAAFELLVAAEPWEPTHASRLASLGERDRGG